MTESIEFAPTAKPLPSSDSHSLLHCQQTLVPLERRGTDLYSPRAELRYPVRNGLVFMGYDERDEGFVLRAMEEERDHQTSSAHIERDLAFLRESVVAVVDIANLLLRLELLETSMRGLEVGSASGWPAWLFAEAGCEMWLCELEPNSLASGLAFAHPNIGEMHRIVCDATLLPFANGAFDFVLSKEYAHHLAEKVQALSEANRVLVDNGLLILFEPVRCLQSAVLELRHPDEHFAHSIPWPRGYLAALHATGFEPLFCANYHMRREGRSSVVRALRERSRHRLRAACRLDPVSRAVMALLGGELLVVARKTAAAEQPRRDASITVIDPEWETWTVEGGYDRSRFVEMLEHAAHGLVRRQHQPDRDDVPRVDQHE